MSFETELKELINAHLPESIGFYGKMTRAQTWEEPAEYEEVERKVNLDEFILYLGEIFENLCNEIQDINNDEGEFYKQQQEQYKYEQEL